MITFDKGSVIRLSNEGTIGIVLGIAESQLPKRDNLAGYASWDAYFSENFGVTILVLLKEDFLYGDEDDYMNSLTQRYVDIILQNVSISKLSYCIEMSLKTLLQSQLVLDKKVDITPYLKVHKKNEKFYSINDVYNTYKVKTKEFFFARNIAMKNWNRITTDNPFVKELRNSYLYFTVGKKQYTFYLYDYPSQSVCRIDRVNIREKNYCDIFLSTKISKRNLDAWIALSDTLKDRLRETNMDMSFLWKYSI